jgi:hypothetical protein
VFYDVETNSRAVGVGFVSPSITSWRFLNPSYRIFTIDGDYEGSSHVSQSINTANSSSKNKASALTIIDFVLFSVSWTLIPTWRT